MIGESSGSERATKQTCYHGPTFIKPRGLSVDMSCGHQLTLNEQDSFLSYFDLPASMIEAVNDKQGRYIGKNTGDECREKSWRQVSKWHVALYLDALLPVAVCLSSSNRSNLVV